MKKIKTFYNLLVLVLVTAMQRICGTGLAIHAEHLEFFSNRATRRAQLEGNLDRADERATDLQHFDENSLEALEQSLDAGESFDASLEDALEQEFDAALEGESVEDLNRMKRNRVTRRMQKRYGRNGALYSAARLTGKKKFLGKRMAGVVAQLTINITRNSYNIPFDLPVELFNSLDAQCGYAMTTQYLNNPDLQLLSATPDATKTNFVFTFRQISTAFTDTVTVNCNEVAYVKLIAGLITDMLEVNGGTIQISDVAQTQQFRKAFWFIRQNILGKGEQNPLNMASFILPSDFRPDIAKILIQFGIDKERGCIFTASYISGTAPGYALTTTLFLNMSAKFLYSIGSPRGI